MPAPDINSNYYIMTSYGGWSPCIEGNNQYGLRPFPGSVLPNCVGYIVGRFNEWGSQGACTWLGSVNANQLVTYATGQGLTTGSDPKVGAAICWDDGIEGHAAFVEQVVDSQTIVVTESGWNYTTTPIVRTKTLTYNGGRWHTNTGYTFQAFIYNPSSSMLGGYYMLWLEDE